MVVALPAVMLVLGLPQGTLPALPGPATLVVMAALCLGCCGVGMKPGKAQPAAG